MPRGRRITHFISFSGEQLAATATNYREDAARYIGCIRQLIQKAANADNEHDRYAYARQTAIYASVAAHSARMARELAASE